MGSRRVYRAAASPAAARRARPSTAAQRNAPGTPPARPVASRAAALCRAPSATLGGVVAKHFIDVTHQMFAGELCARDLLGVDRADPGEALANAGPKSRTVAIDPGAMLLGDLGTLQNAEYIDPFRGNAGIDSLLDDTRKCVPNRCDPRCKRQHDRGPGVRKRIGRNQKTGGHERPRP
jgi:hypothetical protein